jgi:hypothetical protein
MRMNYAGYSSGTDNKAQRAVALEIDFNPDSRRCRSDLKGSTKDMHSLFVCIDNTIGVAAGANNAGQGPTEVAKRNPDVLGYFCYKATDTGFSPGLKRSGQDFFTNSRQNRRMGPGKALSRAHKGACDLLA